VLYRKDKHLLASSSSFLSWISRRACLENR